MGLTKAETELLQELLLQKDIERVSPKLEGFRDPIIGGNCSPEHRIRGCRGGRGAGAKSWSLVSLIVQRAHVQKIRVGCFREIQESLEESVYALIKLKVEMLGYRGWKFQGGTIYSPSGSKFIFKGLKDLRASRNVKGLEGFDIFLIEEASSISMDSWNLLMPTLMRTPGSELWFCYNQEEEQDPVTVKIWNTGRDDALLIELEPGKKDNPWWNSGLQKEMEEDFKLDPDEAEHIWLGQPRKQGQKAVMSRVAIRGAMNRVLKPEGVIQVGCDPARFGDDTTQIYKRHGFVTIDHRGFAGQDTMRTAYECWDLAGRDPSVMIVVDETGIGSGVVDRLRELGAKVVGVNFGGSPTNRDKYTSIADELWFEFPVDEADIPNDTALMQQLSGRQYDYTKDGKRKVESKDRYKERCGKSPDRADAVLLTYFSGGGVLLDKDIREAMKKRRKR